MKMRCLMRCCCFGGKDGEVTVLEKRIQRLPTVVCFFVAREMNNNKSFKMSQQGLLEFLVCNDFLRAHGSQDSDE